MGAEVAVLDHGFVRLVDSMGSDLSIVRAARVSFDADWRAGEDEGSDAKLIRSLMRRGHTSPFEAVAFTFEVKAPIFVLRQWHRHRTWSYNEVSARYTELDNEAYIPDPTIIGVQSAIEKQARDIAGANADAALLAARRLQCCAIRELYDTLFSAYHTLITDDSWPRELARSILPVATYSRMFATVNLHNLFRFLALRLDPHAQYEIRVYAEALLELARGVVPVAVGAFEKFQLKKEKG